MRDCICSAWSPTLTAAFAALLWAWFRSLHQTHSKLPLPRSLRHQSIFSKWYNTMSYGCCCNAFDRKETAPSWFYVVAWVNASIVAGHALCALSMCWCCSL